MAFAQLWPGAWCYGRTSIPTRSITFVVPRSRRAIDLIRLIGQHLLAR